jgi:hypothetical protein
MTERSFFHERVVERARELRQKYPDPATYYVELSKLLLSLARDDREREEAEIMLKDMKSFKRLGIFD